MQLIICEKQLAAKRIAKLLSNNSCIEQKIGKIPYYECQDFRAIGLSGHVYNLDFPKEHSSWTKTKLKELVCAEINYVPEKKSIINAVKKLTIDSDLAIIATDFDTEGESIGLEALNIVKSVKDIPVKRARFSAITKEDIKAAFSNLAELDFNLAHSADARREVDLVWGAVLTRFLSLASHRLGNYYLSVGRVQSPTLKLIVDREKERLAFKPEPYWIVTLKLIKDNATFEARYIEQRIFDKSLVNKLLELNPKKAIVKKILKRKRRVSPPAPLNTTEYIRAASRLGFSSMNAMRIAESLYLKGLISYPRTNNQTYPDTINLSKILGKLKHGRHSNIINNILKHQIKPTKGKASKDHPPIHPTGELPEDLTKQEEKIYDLILRHFLATLMGPSIEELTKASFDVSSYEFISTGLRIMSPGFKAILNNSKETLLPNLAEAEEVEVASINAVDKMTEPPNRYGHGTLIKLMNDLGLGTKATRPGIIQKLIERSYISKQGLVPGPLAFAVVDALSAHAQRIVDPKMTSELERDMELISESIKTKEEVVNNSRKLLLDILEELLSKEQDISNSIREAIRKSKIVGACPKCGSNLIIRVSKASKKRFIGCSNYPNCKNGWPLPQSGYVQVLPNTCSSCGIRKILLIRKGKRPFTFCPNPDCPSKKS